MPIVYRLFTPFAKGNITDYLTDQIWSGAIFTILSKEENTMHIVNVTEAKANLSMLLHNVEERNKEVMIKRGTKIIAKLVKCQQPRKKRLLGAFEGQWKVPDDFDEWPDDIA